MASIHPSTQARWDEWIDGENDPSIHPSGRARMNGYGGHEVPHTFLEASELPAFRCRTCIVLYRASKALLQPGRSRPTSLYGASMLCGLLVHGLAIGLASTLGHKCKKDECDNCFDDLCHKQRKVGVQACEACCDIMPALWGICDDKIDA
eukprot:4202251-Prymnesium_polylepis.1